MPHSLKSNKNPQKPKKAGRFATPEEAARSKNAGLINHIKKLGLKADKQPPSPL